TLKNIEYLYLERSLHKVERIEVVTIVRKNRAGMSTIFKLSIVKIYKSILLNHTPWIEQV
ncbi:MAG: hypothetical protein QXT92_04610, partial [Nitrososphaerota archaeon]